MAGTFCFERKFTMNRPKLIIASDGNRTMALLDGVIIGAGIRQLDFSTEGTSEGMRSTIRILDLDVDRAELSTDTSEFIKWVSGN
jgi:hypothetical protein